VGVKRTPVSAPAEKETRTSVLMQKTASGSFYGAVAMLSSIFCMTKEQNSVLKVTDA
jgi:hypothetical protein